MHCVLRNVIARSVALALAATLTVAGWATPAFAAPDPASTPDPAATLSVADAHAAVVAAEARLTDVTRRRDDARARLDDTSGRAAGAALRLSEVRAELRQQAVDAYIAGSPAGAQLTALASDDLFEASLRVRVLTHAARQSEETAQDYRQLKDDLDPEVARLATELQQLDAAVTDATDALGAARANEAEAERQEALRQEALRQEAARQAQLAAAVRRRAEAAAAAAAAANPSAVVPMDLPDVPAGGPSEAQWARLRQCESSGNYAAVSSSGTYRGAYQFDRRTWATMGGSGDPAAAPPAEQDARAKALYASRGWRPWPVCGRHLI